MFLYAKFCWLQRSNRLPMTIVGCFLCVGIQYSRHWYLRQTAQLLQLNTSCYSCCFSILFSVKSFEGFKFSLNWFSALKQSFRSRNWLHESFYVLILQTSWHYVWGCSCYFKYISASNPWFHVWIFQNDKKVMSVPDIVREIQSPQSSAVSLHVANNQSNNNN